MQGRYRKFDSSVVSYGPCQTPTLGFCVDRHDHILAFVPEDFWELHTDVCKAGVMVPLEWARGRVFDHAVRLRSRPLIAVPVPYTTVPHVIVRLPWTSYHCAHDIVAARPVMAGCGGVVDCGAGSRDI